MPVSTDNNFPVQATGNLPENVAGNTLIPTTGHSPDQDAALSDRATGKLLENAAGLSEEGAGLSEGTTSELRNLDQVICVNHFFIIIYYLFIGINLKHL